jgi:hypothetical protein
VCLCFNATFSITGIMATVQSSFAWLLCEKKIQYRRAVKHHPCSPMLDVSHMSVREMRRFRSSSTYARSGRLPLAPCSLTSRRLELMDSLSSFLFPYPRQPQSTSIVRRRRRTHRSSVAAYIPRLCRLPLQASVVRCCLPRPLPAFT